MKAQDITTLKTDTAIKSLTAFASEIGITGITAWRWRKRGWLKTVNICGRQYVTSEAVDEFKRRAVSGEFAQEHKTPARRDAQ